MKQNCPSLSIVQGAKQSGEQTYIPGELASGELANLNSHR